MSDEEKKLKALEEAYDRLDAVCGKLMMAFGAEATAMMLTTLARKYTDLFGQQVKRLDLKNQQPKGYA